MTKTVCVHMHLEKTVGKCLILSKLRLAKGWAVVHREHPSGAVQDPGWYHYTVCLMYSPLAFTHFGKG